MLLIFDLEFLETLELSIKIFLKKLERVKNQVKSCKKLFRMQCNVATSLRYTLDYSASKNSGSKGNTLGARASKLEGN